ncbi:MAG: zeta toxin family protein [Defluviitaleaceae bacterium]|nr:zeta toxin family protein [Defluviitaleaceae bacterium]
MKTISQKANCILTALQQENLHQRSVVSIYGGSGSGKTETASLVAYELNQQGKNTYVLSGDNYPHRIPKYNDAERLRIFYTEGIKALLSQGLYTGKLQKNLKALCKDGADADPNQIKLHPWLAVYQEGGDSGLRNYLGTPLELDFEELSKKILSFKNGDDILFLKRMGREEWEIWYEPIDFSNVQILIIEWTHGNSSYLKDLIDIPIFLHSTPQETLENRIARGRDEKINSPFVNRVLNIEDELLRSQENRAKLIVSSQNKLIRQSQ